jgi:hypothetical protein
MSDADCMTRTPKSLIEKRLAEGLEDIRRGRVHGPFQTARALVLSLHRPKKTKSS